MSIVVWDGTSLAADRQATNFNMRFETRKIFRLADNEVVAFTGGTPEVCGLLDWVKNGSKKEEWPKFQEDKEHWARMILVSKDSMGAITVNIYEHLPYPFKHYGRFSAWGVGRDFAIGALEMGADAKRAVEVTCKYNTDCGLGVDVFTV